LTTKRLILAGAAVLLMAGCRQDMHDQPRFRPYSESKFWPDGRSARPIIENTVARGYLRADTKVYKGREGDGFVLQIPVPVNKALLQRGQQRYNIYCTPCHGRVGDGEGMVVQRGFKHPPTFHQDRLRNQPDGYIFDVITNGFGSMISYASRIPAEDRWAIVAYVRTLQYSQNAPVADVPEGERSKLDQPPAPAAAKPAQETKH
jgi:cytochrome c